MFLRNTALYTASKLIPAIASVFMASLLTHLLTPARYGIVGLGVVVMMITTFAGFDWQSLSFLRFYRRGDGKYLTTYFALFILASVPVVIGSCVVWFLPLDPDTKGL